jgi:hypothetical protein
MNPVHTFSPYFSKIQSNIILSSTPKSSESSLPYRFLDQILYEFLTAPMRATCPAHLTLCLITLIIFCEAYTLWSSSLCIASHHFLSLRSKYCPQHPALRHPQSVFFPWCERPSFTLTQKTWNIGVFVHFNFYVLSKGKSKEWQQAFSEFNLPLVPSICYFPSQIFELSQNGNSLFF